MKKLLPLALLSTLALPAFCGDAPAAVPAAPAAQSAQAKPAQPGTDAGRNRQRRGRFGSEEDEQAFYKQLAKENPELKGVDTQTPEGKQKVREVLEAKHKNGEMPEVGAMMKVMRSKSHLKLMKLFEMPQEEFSAIEPLLARVEQLRAQKLFVDIPVTIRSLGLDEAMGGGGEEAEQHINGMIKGFLGNAVDPLVKECQDAAKGLKTILADPQANAAEKTDAVARVRKARTAYLAALEKAQLELRGVLTAQQEALLVDYGILD